MKEVDHDETWKVDRRDPARPLLRRFFGSAVAGRPGGQDVLQRPGRRGEQRGTPSVSYTHLDVYKRQEAGHEKGRPPHGSPCLLYTSRCV